MAKKYVKLALMLIIVVSCLYIVSNLRDRAPKPGEFFSQNDLIPLSNKPGNGFYRVWTLWLPKDRNIDTDPIVKKIRDFYANAEAMIPEQAKDLANTIQNLQMTHHLGLPESLSFKPLEPGQRCSLVQTQREEIVKLRETFGFLLDRFRGMVTSPYVQDTSPVFLIEKPLPRLQPWIKLTRIFIASAILTALDGEWEKGMADLFSLLRFSKNYLESSRSLLTYVSASVSVEFALSAIMELADHKDCPDSIFEGILEQIPPLETSAGAFSCKNQMVAEYLSSVHTLDSQFQMKLRDSGMNWLLTRLFYSPERTRFYFYRLFSRYIEYDRTPPYQWQTSPREMFKEIVMSKVSGWFWWWRNPVGKKIFYTISPAIIVHVWSTHRFNSTYSMIRFAAMIKQRHRAGMPWLKAVDPPEIQNSVDPFSGKRFMYVSSGQYLCSVGPNGQLDIGSSSDDIRVPCKLR